jgi:outer membrane autotransporter protein
MIRKSPALLALLAWLCLATWSTATIAATLVITKNGTLRTDASAAKTQAFCSANPDALIQLDTTITPTPTNGGISVNEGSSVNFSVEGRISAYCGASGQQNTRRALINLRFEVLGGSASASDATASTTTLNFASVPVFVASPIAQSFSGTVMASADGLREPDETLIYGLGGGVIIESDSANPQAGNTVLSISSAELVTFVIKDGVLIEEAANRLLPNDDAALDIAEALDTICKKQNLSSDLLAQCQALQVALGASDAAGSASILRALGAEEAATESSSIIENRAGSQQDRINTRLATLHSSAARAATSMTTSLTFNGINFISNTLSDEASGEGGLLDQRLGGFIIADGGRGDRGSSNRENGFDYDRYGLSGGLDYRFADNWVAGFALGFNRYSADLVNNGGALDAKVKTLSLYSSYSLSNGAYLDATLGVGNFAFESERFVRYQAGGRSENRTARGDYDAEQLSATLAIGWPLQYGAWSFIPSLGYEYSRTDSDSFTETGAADLNLRIFGQDVYSSIGSLNFQANRSISIESGVLVPYFGMNYYFEQRNESNPTVAFFPADVDRTRIFIRSDEADTRFGTGNMGLTWYLPSGLQAYLDYRRTFGLSGFSQSGFGLGLRLEF